MWRLVLVSVVLFLRCKQQQNSQHKKSLLKSIVHSDRYLFWFLINACLVNSWIIYRKCSTRPVGKKYTHMDFRLELVDLLTAPAIRRRALPAPVAQIAVDHSNVRMPAKRPRVCKMHRRYNPAQVRNRRTETTRGCKACGIYLCPPCHVRYHLNQIAFQNQIRRGSLLHCPLFSPEKQKDRSSSF